MVERAHTLVRCAHVRMHDALCNVFTNYARSATIRICNLVQRYAPCMCRNSNQP